MLSDGSGHPFTVKFAKTGDARFLSHLDFMRLLERGLRRSGLPLRYTQGFNPHVRLSLNDALPVGVESLDERVLIHLESNLSPETVRDRLASVLPAGIGVVSVAVGDERLTGPAALWELWPASPSLRAAIEAVLAEQNENGVPFARFVVSQSDTDSGIALRLAEFEGQRLKIRDLVARLRMRDPSLALVRARKLPQGDCN
jgi:hypothetical protein